MKTEQILALYDQEMRIEVEFPGIRKEVVADVVRVVGKPEPHGGNFVLYSSLTTDKADQVIQEQIDYFSRIGHPFEWKVYDHDTPPDLRHRLLAQGFTIREPEDAIMVLDLEEATPRLWQPVTADVRRLTHPNQLSEMADLLETVWQEDFSWAVEIVGEEVRQQPDYTSVYMAYVDNEPACSGWINFHPDSQFASLWGV